ncbi:hypothetical protein [Streptosporangium sp. NPDC049376]|uniref:hypothetical protein n=1 Tax=Streptosporangium sp. NPDC049376 TaxID=3366192 RepID=UPI00379D7D1F
MLGFDPATGGCAYRERSSVLSFRLPEDVALVRDAGAVQLVGIGLLLSPAFVSDVFIVGGSLPSALETAEDLFPLKHVSHALPAALDPADRLIRRSWPPGCWPSPS